MDKEARRFAAHGVGSGSSVTTISVQDVLQSASAQEPVMGPVRPLVESSLPDADDYDPFADDDEDDNAQTRVASLTASAASAAVTSNTFSAVIGTSWDHSHKPRPFSLSLSLSLSLSFSFRYFVYFVHCV
jgi:hypothetical protein